MAKGSAFRRVIGLGVIASAAYAVWRAIEANRTPSDNLGWEPQPFPFPPRPRDPTTTTLPAWLEPVDGACPSTHPIKAKQSSGIYHVPGGGSYERTTPDRCYVNAEAAEADGLRAAKR